MKIPEHLPTLSTLFYKAGDKYELIARRELRELKGSEDVREFSCKDLHGVARLAFPKGWKARRLNAVSTAKCHLNIRNASTY
jgi:hypothetical protein